MLPDPEYKRPLFAIQGSSSSRSQTDRRTLSRFLPWKFRATIRKIRDITLFSRKGIVSLEFSWSNCSTVRAGGHSQFLFILMYQNKAVMIARAEIAFSGLGLRRRRPLLSPRPQGTSPGGSPRRERRAPPPSADESEKGFEIVRVACRGGGGGRAAAFIATR